MRAKLTRWSIAALFVFVLIAEASPAVIQREDFEEFRLSFSDSNRKNDIWQMMQSPGGGEGEATKKTTQEKPNEFSWRTPPHHNRDAKKMASILYKNNKFSVFPDVWLPDAIAFGSVAKTLNTTGWDVLDVSAGLDAGTNNDTAIMYAAGLLEGYLTADRIALMYTNMMATFFDSQQSQKVLLPRVRAFLAQQFDWAKKFASASPQSAVARHTGLVLAQLQGLIDGYLSRNDTVVRDPFVLHLLNAVGDMLDLQIALNDTTAEKFETMSQSEFSNFVQQTGHCSALIRVTPGLENLFMGHSTWFTYSALLRSYKHYTLLLNDPDMRAQTISFSSYPGFLSSWDDFYLLSSGMVVLQTTNNVFNLSLYKSACRRSTTSAGWPCNR